MVDLLFTRVYPHVDCQGISIFKALVADLTLDKHLFWIVVFHLMSFEFVDVNERFAAPATKWSLRLRQMSANV